MGIRCLLEKTPGRDGCVITECAGCGWREEVERERREQIRQGKFETGEDGLRRIIIKKKGGTGNDR